MNSILLDTNAYTGYLTGDKQVLEFLAEADIVYISVFVAGELYAGFRGGSKYRENIINLDSFVNKPRVEFLNANRTTADIFGQIKETLKVAGTPLPINDIWIAAHALETGSVLLTYDKYFAKIQGLRLWYYFPE